MIDAHCHLQFEDFSEDINGIISEAKSRRIKKFVVNGTSEKDWEAVADLADSHSDIVLPSFGLHPWYSKNRSANWLEKLSSFLDSFPEALVGEIGLDRWIEGYDIGEQLRAFEDQWKLAVQKERSVTVHCLRAWGHLEQSLTALPRNRFLLHSYSGSSEMVTIFAELGAYFSISGYFFNPGKEKKLAVFDSVPLDKLLIETDAPEMRPPEPMDDFPELDFNHPANLVRVYEEMARRRNLEPEKFEAQTADNFLAWAQKKARA